MINTIKNILLLVVPSLLLFSCFGTKKTTSNPKVEIVTYEQSQDTNTVFKVVEQMPEFPGGYDSMLAYLGRTINYPEEARKKEIEGKVYVQFIVERNGVVSNVKVVKGLGGGCDESALNSIEKMPVWTPGKQRGKPVRVKLILPINFTLASNKKQTSTKTRIPEYIKSNHDEKPIKITENYLADKQAEFPEGSDSLDLFLKANVKYPTELSEKGQEGKVYVQITINPDGRITDSKVLRHIGYGSEEEALRVVKLMPNWIPAEKDGKKIAVKVMVVVRFNLK